MMLKKSISLLCLFILVSHASAIQIPYETAAVGRISGESVNDLMKQLDANSIAPRGATYFSKIGSNDFGDPMLANSQDKTSELLRTQFYGNATIKNSDNSLWNWNELKNTLTVSESAKKNDIFILQTKGKFDNESLLPFIFGDNFVFKLYDSPLSYTSIPPSETNFDSFFLA